MSTLLIKFTLVIQKPQWIGYINKMFHHIPLAEGHEYNYRHINKEIAVCFKRLQYISSVFEAA